MNAPERVPVAGTSSPAPAADAAGPSSKHADGSASAPAADPAGASSEHADGSASAMVAIPFDALAQLIRAGVANLDGAGVARRTLKGLEDRLAVPLDARDDRALRRVARDLRRLVEDARRIRPRLAMPLELWGPVVTLAKACLRHGSTAAKARNPVMLLQQTLDRLGSEEAKMQGREIGRLLDQDARGRYLETLALPTGAKRPGGATVVDDATPETKARLRRDVALTWWERGKLSDAGFGAATEIREIADAIAMAEHPAQPLVRVRVDGGRMGLAPVERLAGVLSSHRGRHYLDWCHRLAATPVIGSSTPEGAANQPVGGGAPGAAVDKRREIAAAEAGVSMRTGSLLDLVMAVVVLSVPIGNAAKLVRVRKERVQELVIEALEAYAGSERERERMARLGDRQREAAERAERGQPYQLHELVFLNAEPEHLPPGAIPDGAVMGGANMGAAAATASRRDPTQDRLEPVDMAGQPDQQAPWTDPEDPRQSPRIGRVVGGRLGWVGYRPDPLDALDVWTCREIRRDVIKGRGSKIELGLRYNIEPAAVSMAIERADDFDRANVEGWWRQQIEDMAGL